MVFAMEHGVCGYSHHKPVLRNIDFSVTQGEVLCILGANGAGKSTLFKSILGLIPLIDGKVTIDGSNIRSWKRSRIARTVGYIPQATNPPFSYSVLDVVLMGRTAYLGSFQSPGGEDEETAREAISQMGIYELTNKRFLELSGGEKQLVLIARALTQRPEILIMDEPTAALDFGNQQLVLKQVNILSGRGLSIIMASHFPDHAFLYANRALLVKNGGIFGYGQPDEVITEENLKELYSVDAKIIDTGLESRSVAGSRIKVTVPLE